MNKSLIELLSHLDITQAFKTKGNLRRWSAKRTIGGVIVMTACNEALEHGISWPIVIMNLVGILPICLSFFENDFSSARKKHS